MDEHAAEKLKTMEQTFRERGLPLTHQRRVVMEVLLQRADHPTADQVFETVQDRSPQVSRRTVYRVLDALAELGLIRRVHHPGATARFDAKTQRHHHLVCLRCNKIMDLENTQLDNIPLPKGKLHGFDISDYSVQLMGICPDCRKGKKKQ